MFYNLFSAIVALCLFTSLSAKDSIRIETFQGPEITPYTKDIVLMADRIYREYPYLYAGNNADYESYLESYSNSPDAIICLVFDGDKIVGLAAGRPMLQARNQYQKTLAEHGYQIDTIFYLGEFGLAPEYAGQGIETKMYQKIANFAAQKGSYKTIAIWEIDDSANLKERPQGYIPRDAFWKKLGFNRQPELDFIIYWENINEAMESPHLAVYWLKSL